MAEVRFYHLTTTPLERALPQLLEKATEAGFRSFVKLADEAAMDRMNAALWVYDPASFLPHGSRKDGDAAMQPIYLSDDMDNANNANMLAVTDGSQADAGAYERVLDLFDGNEPEAVASARERWKTYKDAGVELQYWKQTEQGGWSKSA